MKNVSIGLQHSNVAGRATPSWWALLMTALVSVGCGAQLSDPGTDSSTQFWGRCDEDSECGEARCICGRCTQTCSESRDCADLARKAECVAAASAPACETETVQLCVPQAVVTSNVQESLDAAVSQNPDTDADAAVSQSTSSSADVNEDTRDGMSEDESVPRPEPSLDASARAEAPMATHPSLLIPSPTHWDQGWVNSYASASELSLEGIDGAQWVKYIALGRDGNVFMVVGIAPDAEGHTEALLRLDPDGSVAFSDSFSGTVYGLAVDGAGDVYQARNVNEVGLLDRYTPEGEWLWSSRLYNYPDFMKIRIGRDGVPYVFGSPGQYLWKLDSDGQMMWHWQPEDGKFIVNFEIDAEGTLYAESGIMPEVPFTNLVRGQNPPLDQLFFMLDASGALVAQRRYPLAPDQSPTGPNGYVVTQDGNLLGATSDTVTLFDPAGDVVWELDAKRLDPAGLGYAYGLSRGRCLYCVSNAAGVFAIDADGEPLERLLLPEGRMVVSWDVDEDDNVYAFLRQDNTTSALNAILEFADGAGWEPL